MAQNWSWSNQVADKKSQAWVLITVFNIRIFFLRFTSQKGAPFLKERWGGSFFNGRGGLLIGAYISMWGFQKFQGVKRAPLYLPPLWQILDRVKYRILGRCPESLKRAPLA